MANSCAVSSSPTPAGVHTLTEPIPSPAQTPQEILSRWPADRPAAALISHGDHPVWSRWSILASPSPGATLRVPADRPDEAIAALRGLFAGPLAKRRSPAEPPFSSGWIGWLSYDLGRHLEPRATARPEDPDRAQDDRGWPLLVLHRCESALLHDAQTGRWLVTGSMRDLPALDAAPPMRPATEPGIAAFGESPNRHDFERAVARAIELIRAGDIFQANLAHRLSAPFEGPPRAIAQRLLAAAAPWFGAYIESGDGSGALREAVCSLSPELFLRLDAPDARVTTRPIKGTRPSRAGARALLESEKDAAELAMIIDLMRNDLGRTCEFGSVRVDEARAVERHAGHRNGVLHGVATVSGTLRREASIFDLLRAAFPPGSVTGAPKIRAMQVIDALEPVRRGPYCGAVGYISDTGDACFNVAIRTAALSCEPGSSFTHARGLLDFSVGAGIVADSRPDEEWDETMAKARSFLSALRAGAPKREVIIA